jgi:hypothetical protein
MKTRVRRPPAEEPKATATWQQRWDQLVARIRSRVPANVSDEEIEHDIDTAIAEVRRARRP